MKPSQTPLPHLIHAEKQAAEIIYDARRRKTILIKKAKYDANKEVEQYGTEREEKLNKLTTHANEGLEVLERKLANTTKEKIAKIDEQVGQNSEKVINRLLKLLYDFKPEAHPNHQFLKEEKQDNLMHLVVAKRKSEAKLSI
ncbi:V-type proton ATPase subunit G 2 [Zeugodacus cucurbitae]|uniref:V-type proton ATPase subunit G n=1 Tax=Zeugodacus cucurbitae TaxID=28588 RepID=A0A0A1WPJ9_ZEUCU|nr:V-type proton ATPase subunit G 2 [Zeugodacus cucurbitae]